MASLTAIGACVSGGTLHFVMSVNGATDPTEGVRTVFENVSALIAAETEGLLCCVADGILWGEIATASTKLRGKLRTFETRGGMGYGNIIVAVRVHVDDSRGRLHCNGWRRDIVKIKFEGEFC